MKILFVANSISEVGLSKYRFPSIAVYWHPDDFPECCVARVYEADQPTNIIMLRRSLEELEWDIQRNTNLTFLPRCKEDHLSVFGVWM